MNSDTNKTPPQILKLLAHEIRWQLLRALANGDLRVGELVTQLGQPANLVSYHLRQLHDGGLVSTRRSDADGRDIYYTLEVEQLRALFQAAGDSLHPAVAIPSEDEPMPTVGNLSQPIRVLFVCTHNSARSQMAEGLLRARAGEQVEVVSAGSHPTVIHPEAIRTMDALDIDIRGQTVNHLDDYTGQQFDFVITVCDYAREVCPAFPSGQQYHWGLRDPAAVPDPDERRQTFIQTANRLQTRINHMLLTLGARAK